MTRSDRAALLAEAAKADTSRPSLIIVQTQIVFRNHRWLVCAKTHGEPLGEENWRKPKALWAGPQRRLLS
jgi:transketolase